MKDSYKYTDVPTFRVVFVLGIPRSEFLYLADVVGANLLLKAGDNVCPQDDCELLVDLVAYIFDVCCKLVR